MKTTIITQKKPKAPQLFHLKTVSTKFIIGSNSFF